MPEVIDDSKETISNTTGLCTYALTKTMAA